MTDLEKIISGFNETEAAFFVKHRLKSYLPETQRKLVYILNKNGFNHRKADQIIKETESNFKPDKANLQCPRCSSYKKFSKETEVFNSNIYNDNLLDPDNYRTDIEKQTDLFCMVCGYQLTGDNPVKYRFLITKFIKKLIIMKIFIFFVSIFFVCTQITVSQTNNMYVSKQNGTNKLIGLGKQGYNYYHFTQCNPKCDTLICKNEGYEKCKIDARTRNEIQNENEYNVFNKAIRKTVRYTKHNKEKSGTIHLKIHRKQVDVTYENADNKGSVDMYIKVEKPSV